MAMKRLESPEIYSCICVQLIVDKSAKTIQWRKERLFSNGAEKLGYLHTKE